MTNSQLPERTFLLLFLTWGLLLVLFLWSLSPVLGPLVLFLALAYLLAPYYGTGVYGRVVTVLGLLTVLWLIWSAGFILTPFVLALVLAYILNPLVNRVQRQGLGRTLATVVVLFALLLVGAIAAVALGPLLVEQISAFIRALPSFLEGAVEWLQRLLDRVAHIPLPGLRRTEVGELLDIDSARVDEYLASQGEAIRGALLSGVIGVGKGLGIAFTVFLSILLTLVVTFFLLRDFNKLIRNAARLVPPHRRASVFAFFGAYNELLGRFLRSQLVVALLVGIIVGLGFWIAGFPYALLLGALAGVFNIVPYLGFWVSLGPAILIALVSGNVLVDLAKVAVVFGVEQALENFLSPRIVGESVGLHPVWVMLSIVVFGVFFGFIGVLIAVPVAVALKLLLGNVVRSYEESAYYSGGSGEGEVARPAAAAAVVEGGA